MQCVKKLLLEKRFSNYDYLLHNAFDHLQITFDKEIFITVPQHIGLQRRADNYLVNLFKVGQI